MPPIILAAAVRTPSTPGLQSDLREDTVERGAMAYTIIYEGMD